MDLKKNFPDSPVRDPVRDPARDPSRGPVRGEVPSEVHGETDAGRRALLIAAGVALLVYAITLGGTLVYDDLGILKGDPRMVQPWQWLHFAWESYNGGVDHLYRPLVSWSFALQLRLTGDTPWPMHAVNWLLHAAVSALVALLALRLANWRAAVIAGVLFAVHPIHVEAVANLAGRAELMCAAAVLGAIVLLTYRPMTPWRATGVAACMLAAMLSKEQGMLVPLAALLLAVSYRAEGRGGVVVDEQTTPPKWVDRIASFLIVGPPPRDPRERRSAVTLLLLLCWLTAAYILFREQVLKFEWDRSKLEWAEQPMVRCAPLDLVLMPIVLIGRYASLMVAPIRLSPTYDARVIGYIVQWSDFYLYLGLAVVLAYVFAIMWSWRRRDAALLFCLLAAGLFYGAVGNIVLLTGTIFGERLIYLPSAFLLIAVAIIAARSHARMVWPFAAIVALLWAGRAVAYSARWNDRMSFYERSLVEQPRSAKLQILLADEYRRTGKLDQADSMAAAARKTTPDYAEVWFISAKIAKERGDFDRALDYVKQAEVIRPGARVVAWRRDIQESRSAATTHPLVH